MRCNGQTRGLTIHSGGRTDSIAAKTVIWAGGITASPLGKILASRTRVESDRGGRVKVKSDLTILNYPDIYVIGDLAWAADANGKPLPGLAQVAMQGGTYVAKAILRRVKNQPELPPFHYFDKGLLAVIGRAAAVADVFGLHISGFLAWLVWAFIHVTYLISFQSRILVFIQWAIQESLRDRYGIAVMNGKMQDRPSAQRLRSDETGWLPGISRGGLFAPVISR